MLVSVVRPCGMAETENTEKRMVIETEKMVDFIMYNERRGDYTRLFLEGVRTRKVILPKKLATPSLYRPPPFLPSQISSGSKHRETAQHGTAYHQPLTDDEHIDCYPQRLMIKHGLQR